MRTLKAGMSGPDVMELQAVLKKIGFYPGDIDGDFGPQTRASVIRFQRSFGLPADGVVGPMTFKTLERYLLGYETYTIRPGDTFYRIANRYSTDINLLMAANPGLTPTTLRVGQKITVPYGYNVVDTNIGYSYGVLDRNIRGLKARYPFMETGSIGKSVLGRELFYLRLGTGANRVLYNGAHHALEWITSPVLMKFAEEFLKSYSLGQRLAGFDPRKIWEQSSIYIIPMVNPDGVDLVINGLSPDNPYYSDLIAWNRGSTDFSNDWQANNHGVDLNHNYNAAWQLSKDAEAEYGVTGPGPTRYSGPYPLSEPESSAMVSFTNSMPFRLVMAYHSQGRVIYWNFMNMAPPEAHTIGEELSRLSGYKLDETTGIASYAGYKDWFIQDFRRPGYTIEVGMGVNPLPISQLEPIYRDNVGMLMYAATA